MDCLKDIIQIKGTGPSSNSYIVKGEKNVLIDSGASENHEVLKKAIDEVGSVEIVLCTHGHYDHYGGAVMLRKRMNLKIGVHEADAREMESDVSLLTCEQYFGRKHESTKVDFLLRDGEKIEGTELEVIHTPGHSPGSVCFFLRSKKILFTGDLIFAGGYVGRTDLVGSDHEVLVRSIERIAKLDVDVIFPGHGKPVISGANDYIKQVLERVKSSF